MASPTVQEATEREIAIIEAVRLTVPAAIERRNEIVAENTCILNARVGFEVLKRFGVRVRALPVKVAIWNRACIERIDREGRLPRDQAEMQRWSREDGSWGLGIGGLSAGPTEPGRFNGHVVLLTHYNSEEFDGVLLDLALQQNSRPSKAMHLEPVAASAPKGFLTGQNFMVEVGDCVVRYDNYPEAEGWINTKDWRDVDRRQPIIEDVIPRVEKAIAA